MNSEVFLYCLHVVVCCVLLSFHMYVYIEFYKTCYISEGILVGSEHSCAKDPVETTIIRVQALELLRLGVRIGPPGSTHPTCPLLRGVPGWWVDLLGALGWEVAALAWGLPVVSTEMLL